MMSAHCHLCVCNNLIASAVWFCTELDPVKISPSSGCQYKGGRSKNKKKKQHLPPPLPDEQMLISLRESERFANLSVCTATEFKGTPPWHESGGRRRWQRDETLDCIACSALSRPLAWRWRALLDNSPVKVHEDYWGGHIKRDRTNSITHHQVAAWQQVGEKETGSVNRLHLR